MKCKWLSEMRAKHAPGSSVVVQTTQETVLVLKIRTPDRCQDFFHDVVQYRSSRSIKHPCYSWCHWIISPLIVHVYTLTDFVGGFVDIYTQCFRFPRNVYWEDVIVDRQERPKTSFTNLSKEWRSICPPRKPTSKISIYFDWSRFFQCKRQVLSSRFGAKG